MNDKHDKSEKPDKIPDPPDLRHGMYEADVIPDVLPNPPDDRSAPADDPE